MSPRTPAQFAELREESRERIVQGAMRVFAQRGYERASVRLISREAGVSQGLIYNYFTGKEELLKAVYERGMRDVAASFAEAEGSPEEKLEALIRSSFAVVERNREFWQLSYGVRMQPAVLAALADEVRDSSEIILRRIEGLLRAAKRKEARVEAAVLFALIDGIAQHYVLDPEHYPLKKVVARVVAWYCPPAVGDARG